MMETRYILILLYHPKPGMEKKFLDRWDQTWALRAKHFSASEIALSANQENGEFLFISHWKDIGDVEKFIDYSDEEHDLYLIPPSKEIYKIAKSVA
jgi:hypothetical protein